MPNLKITASPKSAVRINDRLHMVDSMLRKTLRADAVNLLLMDAAIGPTSAAIYAELLYGMTPDRTKKLISGLGHALSETLGVTAIGPTPMEAYGNP